MPFPYGDSYYGLRTFGQSDGTVQDASATVTASSSTSDVGWIVSIGSGAISISASSSTTATGESVIIERTDEYAYGSGLYGIAEYTQGDLQTIVIGQSSTASVGGEKINLGSASVSASSSTTSDSEKIFQSQTYAILPEATTTCAGAYTINVSPNTIEAEATVTPNIERVRFTTITSSVTSGTASIGREKWERIPRGSETWTEIAA